MHRALFAARHDDGRNLKDPDVIADVLNANGVDAESVFGEIADGWPLETIRKEHEAAANDHTVWGVPTFISGDRAVFVRLMDRPEGDAAHATRSVERVVELLDGWPELNEFKWTVRTK